MWTVEWIDADGLQALQVDCSAASSVHDSYELVLLQKRNASMRAEGPTASASKRKRAGLQDDRANKSSKLQREPESKEKQSNDAGSVNNPHQLQQSTHPDHGAEVHRGAEVELKTTDALETEPMEDDEQPGENAQSANHYFYLLKPGTSSAAKILIPLDSQATLTASLQDQSVLEYPTIYALPQSPEALPPAYLLEKDYNKIRKGEEDELNDAIKQAGAAATAPGLREQETASTTNAPIDPQRILDMLKRDITR